MNLWLLWCLRSRRMHGQKFHFRHIGHWDLQRLRLRKLSLVLATGTFGSIKRAFRSQKNVLQSQHCTGAQALLDWLRIPAYFAAASWIIITIILKSLANRDRSLSKLHCLVQRLGFQLPDVVSVLSKVRRWPNVAANLLPWNYRRSPCRRGNRTRFKSFKKNNAFTANSITGSIRIQPIAVHNRRIIWIYGLDVLLVIRVRKWSSTVVWMSKIEGIAFSANPLHLLGGITGFARARRRTGGNVGRCFRCCCFSFLAFGAICRVKLVVDASAGVRCAEAGIGRWNRFLDTVVLGDNCGLIWLTISSCIHQGDGILERGLDQHKTG